MGRPGVPRKTPGGWLCSAGPLSVTSANPYSCEALKSRAKLTRKGTHVTTYKPINIGVRRPQGREAKGGNKPRESEATLAGPGAEMVIMCHRET